MLYTMPEIDNRISLGNVITLGVLLLSGTMAFTAVQGQTNAHGEEIKDHEARVRALEATLAGSLARIEQRLITIERGLGQ